MNPQTLYQLPERGITALGGADRVSLLQGLISNDVTLVDSEYVRFAGLLTAQGKFLYDLMIASDGENILLEAEASRRHELVKLLQRYRLRADVSFHDRMADWKVWALSGSLSYEIKKTCIEAGGIAFIDPRLADLGWRLILPRGLEAVLLESGFELGDPRDYKNFRLGCGIAEGSGELAVGRDNLLEANFDKLNGISWNKGCYVGQEVTARIKYRGRVKKRLFPVRCQGLCPPAGTTIHWKDQGKDQVVGELRGGTERQAIALLRLEPFAQSDEALLTAAGRSVTANWPDWMK